MCVCTSLLQMSMRQTCLIPTPKADLQIPNLMQAAIKQLINALKHFMMKQT